jgi:hypothetical protein
MALPAGSYGINKVFSLLDQIALALCGVQAE